MFSAPNNGLDRAALASYVEVTTGMAKSHPPPKRRRARPSRQRPTRRDRFVYPDRTDTQSLDPEVPPGTRGHGKGHAGFRGRRYRPDVAAGPSAVRRRGSRARVLRNRLRDRDQGPGQDWQMM